ncbi:ABC transporter substrate-binding protein [Microbacterium sp.]|uniref:ABC transporter substrate-binding protein n=1 Tax=Microbacterium sp. TaxID=51671 RepID=UPI0039E35EC9
MATAAVLAAGAMVFSGCTPPRESEVVEGSKITIADTDQYYAFNDGLADTNSAWNANINYLAKSSWYYYDSTPELVKNEGFGTYEKLSDDPLTVKWTVNEGVKWSDGVQVGAADMLLGWASGTTHRSDGEGTVDEESGELTSQTGTFWNTGAQADYGFDLVTDVPEISDDGRSVTLVYSSPFVDWELANPMSPVAAHAAVELAYPDDYTKNDADDAKKANEALIKAVQDNDLDFLAPVSQTFNQGFKFSESVKVKDGDPQPLQLIGTGAYNIVEINMEEGYTTLKANPLDTWDKPTHYETITVRAISSMADQIKAIQNGEIQIASGQPTSDITDTLEAGVDGVDFKGAPQGTYEHIDLQVGNGGPFDPTTYGGDADKALKVREAFLKTIPRQEILDKIVKPNQPDATLRNSQIFIPGTEGAKAAEAVNGYAELTEPDIEGAKALLAEAGVTTPISVRFLSSTRDTRIKTFELWEPYAKEAGFDLTNVADDLRANWSTTVFSNPTAYDATLFAWVSESLAVGESAANYQGVEGPSNTKGAGANNPYGWYNADLNDVFTELSGEFDPAKQQDLQVEAEKIVGEEAWSVPLYQWPGIVVWSNEVTGVTPGFLSPSYFWNYWEWEPVAGATATPAS